jgi:spectrin beta
MLQALAGAKQVHVFDRRADETIGWIQEKDAALSGQGYGQDLETIQALVRQHQVFETDLAAVKEQVCHCQHTAAVHSNSGIYLMCH